MNAEWVDCCLLQCFDNDGEKKSNIKPVKFWHHSKQVCEEDLPKCTQFMHKLGDSNVISSYDI